MTPLRVVPLALRTLVSVLSLTACREEPEGPTTSSPIGEALAELRSYEAARRAATDFTRVVGRHRALGPDPSAIVRVEGGFVGLLRGRDEVVLLGDDLSILDAAPGPLLATDLTTLGGDLVAIGRGAPRVLRYRVEAGRLRLLPPLDLLPGTRGRALASDGELGFAVDDVADTLVVFDEGGERRRIPTGARPVRVAATPTHVVVATLVSHRVEIFRRDAEGLPVDPPVASIVRRGPAWGLSAVDDEEGGLWVAVAAVEDAPLDRTVGSFGYVDSVVELHRLRSPGPPELLATFEAGAHGVVVPKAIALEVSGSSVRLRALGAGSDRAAEVLWGRTDRGVGPAPDVETWAIPPGTSAAVFGEVGEVGAVGEVDGAPRVLAAASPLLDGFWGPGGLAPVEGEASPPRTASSRLGEALLTTTLLAPAQTSEGPRSRFTCETCHFELGIDGRTHATGRADDTVATTKPLFGLFNGAPHFTRAMDRDLTEVAHNEARVANEATGRHPWSAIDPVRAPWLHELLRGEPEPDLLSPLGVRRALVDVLADLAHAPNPRAWGRGELTSTERAGAGLFRDRCASCHAARLVVSDPSTEIPFERWEGLILSEEGPIVWARDGHERTGVVPYVHEDGARTTSLRRVIEKRPYFTNGSATSLREVLERARWGADGTFLHAGEDVGAARLGDLEVERLLGFLSLL